MKVDTVIFDVGNVLVRWDPQPLIEALAGTPEAAAEIGSTVITHDWNIQMDAGKSWAQGCAELAAAFPQHAGLIHAFNARWEETIHGEVDGTPEILLDLQRRDVPLYALTNFSSEKFALTRRRYDFFRVFRDIVVSGDEGLIKPDSAIYRLLLDRNGLDAGRCVFIDDSAANIEAARAVGLDAIHFFDAAALSEELSDRGFL